MAFTRKFLAALGIEAEKIEEIINAHVEVVSGLKEQIAESKDSAEQLAKVTAERDALKQSLAVAEQKIADAEKDDFKGKYEAEKREHEELKSSIAAKETAAKKEAALTAAAKAAKFSDEAIALILDSKADYASRIEIGKDGKATNTDDVIAAITADRPSLAPKATAEHHTPATPPASAGASAKPTKESIMSIKNTAERQKAIAANPELFPQLAGMFPAGNNE